MITVLFIQLQRHHTRNEKNQETVKLTLEKKIWIFIRDKGYFLKSKKYTAYSISNYAHEQTEVTWWKGIYYFEKHIPSVVWYSSEIRPSTIYIHRDVLGQSQKGTRFWIVQQ